MFLLGILITVNATLLLELPSRSDESARGASEAAVFRRAPVRRRAAFVVAIIAGLMYTFGLVAWLPRRAALLAGVAIEHAPADADVEGCATLERHGYWPAVRTAAGCSFSAVMLDPAIGDVYVVRECSRMPNGGVRRFTIPARHLSKSWTSGAKPGDRLSRPLRG